eukprot:365925-Chlamydomonas_euryale.AAC.4
METADGIEEDHGEATQHERLARAEQNREQRDQREAGRQSTAHGLASYTREQRPERGDGNGRPCKKEGGCSRWETRSVGRPGRQTCRKWEVREDSESVYRVRSASGGLAFTPRARHSCEGTFRGRTVRTCGCCTRLRRRQGATQHPQQLRVTVTRCEEACSPSPCSPLSAAALAALPKLFGSAGNAPRARSSLRRPYVVT